MITEVVVGVITSTALFTFCSPFIYVAGFKRGGTKVLNEWKKFHYGEDQQ